MKFNKKNAEVYYQLGALFERKETREDLLVAEEYYQTCLDMDPSHPEASPGVFRIQKSRVH